MAKQKGQDAKRRRTFFKDQHGRKYFANVEIETGDPLDLAAYAWTAPLAPHWARGRFLPPIGDPEVVRVIPDDQRADFGCDVFIDYAKWEEKQHARNRQREDQMREMVRGMAGNGADITGMLENPSPKILEYLGPEAFPPVELIRAMRAENPWALGLTDVVPEKAGAMLERLRPQMEQARTALVDHDADVLDPFADDDNAEGAANFNALMDLEEQHDPFAEGGGKRHPVRDVTRVGKGRKPAEVG